MPEPTIIHFTKGNLTPVCGADGTVIHTSDWPGEVTCFICRKTPSFKRAQLASGVGTPTPIKLSGVMADDEALNDLAAAAFRESKNGRGMYVVEEFIHHGNYRSTRRVEVYDVTASTMDGVLMSSAYCYGSWQNPEDERHTKHRRDALMQLVDDLRHLRTNRSIGWSTFRIITPEEH